MAIYPRKAGSERRITLNPSDLHLQLPDAAAVVLRQPQAVLNKRIYPILGSIVWGAQDAGRCAATRLMRRACAGVG